MPDSELTNRECLIRAYMYAFAHIYGVLPLDMAATAFAPYENPKIAVTCVIEQGYSGTKAGYSIKDVFDYYFGLN